MISSNILSQQGNEFRLTLACFSFSSSILWISSNDGTFCWLFSVSHLFALAVFVTGDHGPGEITAKDGKIKLNFDSAYYSIKQLNAQQFITLGITSMQNFCYCTKWVWSVCHPWFKNQEQLIQLTTSQVYNMVSGRSDHCISAWLIFSHVIASSKQLHWRSCAAWWVAFLPLPEHLCYPLLSKCYAHLQALP